MLSRRNILATAAAGAMSAATARAATFGDPDQPAEGAVNVTNPKALTDPKRPFAVGPTNRRCAPDCGRRLNGTIAPKPAHVALKEAMGHTNWTAT